MTSAQPIVDQTCSLLPFASRIARMCACLGACSLALVILPAHAQTAPSVASVSGQNAAVEAIPFQTPDSSLLAARKPSYDFTVTGKDWLDTKVMVTAGDRLTLAATGNATLADGRTTTPAGVQRGWRDLVRTFPDNAADVATLIGRVSSEEATVPFSIGTGKELAIAATGTLFLRINTSADLAATGTYAVTLKISREAAGLSLAAPDLTRSISPHLFDSLPRRVQDQVGDPGDMVNFSLIGTQDQVEKAFAAAGWVAVDKNDQEAVMHGLLATLQHQAYTGVPMSTLYLFGRPQDLSFERAAPIAVAAVRHHLRVWRTAKTVAGQPLWVGSATHDEGFERDQRNGGVTHHVDPNIDDERDFLEKSFAYAGALTAAAYITPPDPFRSAKTATGGAIQSDGRIALMQLRTVAP